MASLQRRLRARLLKAFFRAHTRLYEWSDGRLGNSTRLPVLLLTTTGRVTGKARTTPLVYFRRGEDFVVVGSDGAARRHPQWYRNLLAKPLATLRVGREVFEAEARTAEGEERAALVRAGAAVNPMWQRYQGQTERELPYVVLTRKTR